MSKYNFYDDDIHQYNRDAILEAIANELAEANRLTRWKLNAESGIEQIVPLEDEV